MESRTLTLATLVRKGACREQREKFAKLFGKSVEITEALCAEHANEFNWDWAARNLLSASASARAAYDAAVAPALAAYDAAMAPAWAAYDAARASAQAAYDAAMAPAWAAYDAAMAPAWAAYAAAMAPARAAYAAAMASAWARAYIADGKEKS